MKFLEELRSEHQVILKFLVYFDNMLDAHADGSKIPSRDDYALALGFIEIYIDQLHHAKEELALFPTAFEVKLLQGGGPKCMLYFGKFLESGFLNKFKHEINIEMNDGKTIAPYMPRAEIQSILSEKDPLCIPLEDHQSGYYALEIIKYELKQRDTDAMWTGDRLFRIGRWYIEMLRQHIGKEDECLFVRLEEILKPEQVQALDAWVPNFNEKALRTKALIDLVLLKERYNK